MGIRPRTFGPEDRESLLYPLILFYIGMKNKKKKEGKKKHKKKKKTGALSFVFRPGLLLTRTRGLKWKIGTKGMVDRARGRVSKIRESLEFVCRARPIQCTRLVTSTSF